MNKKKIIIIVAVIVIVFVSVLLLVPRPVEEHYETKTVEIVDKRYNAKWTDPIKLGNMTIYVTWAPEYYLTVEYEGEQYTFKNASLYKKYKGADMTEATGTIRVRTYKDGTVENKVIKIE